MWFFRNMSTKSKTLTKFPKLFLKYLTEDCLIWKIISLQRRRILGGRKMLVYVCIVVTAISDFMTEEDYGESK